MDIVDKQTRSRMMANIRGKNTAAEIAVRKRLFAAGFRYRLYDSRLPGKPDIVLPRYKTVIFIHGCFWHGHNCPLYKIPTTRTEFWKNKLEGNRKRDLLNKSKLIKMTWRVVSIYECSWRLSKTNQEIRFDQIITRVKDFILHGTNRTLTIQGTNRIKT